MADESLTARRPRLSTRVLQGFADLYDQVTGGDWHAAVPGELPVLILSGDQDSVAKYGEGAYHVGNRLVASGHPDVRTASSPACATRCTTSPRVTTRWSGRSASSPPA